MTGSGAVTLLICLFVEHENERHGIAWTHCNGPEQSRCRPLRLRWIGPQSCNVLCQDLEQSVNHHSRSRYHTRPSRARQKHPHDSECHGHRTLACNRLRELPSQAPERLRRPCSCLGCLHDPVDDGNTLHLIMIPKSEIGDRV